AERVQAEREPQYGLLYALQGFRYCDWLLAPAERATWRVLLGRTFPPTEPGEHAGVCGGVQRRGDTMFAGRIPNDSLLDIGVEHLTLARVGLYRVIMLGRHVLPGLNSSHVAAALTHLRRANDFMYLPQGLLTAALYHFVRG